MSWNFEVKGVTKEHAKAAVMADKNVSEWKYCPIPVAEGICLAINAVAEPEDAFVLVVKTHGHITPQGNQFDNASFSITYGPRE